MSEENNVLSHPARVRLVITSELHDHLARQVQMRGLLDEQVLAEHPPFYFRAEISNDLLDSHFTRMAESTLRNYAEDATNGVAFLKGHNWKDLPIGYSIQAAYGIDGGKQRVIADFYTVSGLPETDDLIARMRTGLVRDVSVGFHGGSASCDICGNDLFECRHYPGLKYETKEGDTVRQQLATFTINDARLSEVSGVFDGSTPEAGILKAERAIKDGTMTAKEHDLLQHRYRVKLPPVKSVHAGVDVTEAPQNTKEKTVEEKQFARFTQLLVTAGLVNEAERSTLDEETALVQLDKLVVRTKELEPLAADGRQYRQDLIAEALSEGVRAHGNSFDKETYQTMLTAAPIQHIKRMRDDWKGVAAQVIPTGRHSVDDDQTESKPVKVSLVPDAAYR